MIAEFSRQADRNLTDIHAYIAEDDERAAERVISWILQGTQYLETFPEMGRPGRIVGTRELPIAGLPYVAIYRSEGVAFEFSTVLHDRQQWP